MTSVVSPPSWLVLALGDQRKYAGNAGYADEVEKAYRYDSFVQYHRQLAQGDVLLLKGPEGILGMAQIERVRSGPGTKEQRKCPVCRRTVGSSTRCKKGHRFDRPIVEMVDCREYVADFGDSFTTLNGVALPEVRKACPGLSLQMAIKPLDLDTLLPHIITMNPAVANWAKSRLEVDELPGAEADVGTGEYVPVGEDSRRRAIRHIKLRRGQREFRDALRSRYGDRCLVSGCELLDIIEAAHISPYRGETDNHAENGLLLRADIHTLFDLDLIAVNPLSLRVSVHPAAAAAGYDQFEGRRLLIKKAGPSKTALERRWRLFERAVASGGLAQKPPEKARSTSAE